MHRDELRSWLSDAHRRPLVMGILNVTPDSFSDGGKFADPEQALRHAERLVADGADWIDVGAESTRPGSARVSPDEQLHRLDPLFKALRRQTDVILSIDTTRALVAQAALDAEWDVVNDISAGRDDVDMLTLAAERSSPIILMHMQGDPATMQVDPRYANVTRDVRDFLAQRSSAAIAAGLDRRLILWDPGFGFGKNTEHNLQLLAELDALAAEGQPLVVGTSRKRFIGCITGEKPRSGCAYGTAATVAWAVAHGAAAVRVHDVIAMAPVAAMVRALQSAKATSGQKNF